MFDYFESLSDEFFVSVKKDEMDPAMRFFMNTAHDRVYLAFSMALGRVCRGMGKDQ